MAGARFIGVVAVLMLISGSMPWLIGPFGNGFVPFDALPELFDMFSNRPELISELPLSAQIFLGAWTFAALLTLTALFLNWSPRLLVFLTGLAPFASIFILVAEMGSAGGASSFGGIYGQNSGLNSVLSGYDRSSGDVLVDAITFWDNVVIPILNAMEIGAKLFFGSAIALILLSILMPPRKLLKRAKKDS